MAAGRVDKKQFITLLLNRKQKVEGHLISIQKGSKQVGGKLTELFQVEAGSTASKKLEEVVGEKQLGLLTGLTKISLNGSH